MSMHIKTITYQHRRDFFADFECENCGFTEEHVKGYDDDNYHRVAVPKRVCPCCHKSALDLGSDYRPLTAKYPEWMSV